ncbi:hypothetical protein [Sphingomonas sp. NIBR02145]|uniref:hypothetical protein n=1 Tax=Sphingomonas sp. NIBR02145 TaxID=3014784 RepID=UPI0022B3650A|nr:hypothetical protein [Sphingomonas sp. NIBR02145]WHU05010.1 hypothetical protein O3305_10595 [Sphingomonas sp. NIBR02145]
MGLALAFPAPALAGPEQAVGLKRAVMLEAAELRVRDLVELRGVRLPARIADMIVMRLPLGTAKLDLPAEQAAALVRRRVPGLRPAAVRGAVVRIRTTATRPGTEAAELRVPGRCFEAAASLAAGATLTQADISEAGCDTRPVARMRYSSGGLVSAVEPVAAGSYLGRLPRLPERAIGKGASLTLRSSAGPVTIERSVVAMQPARSGGKLFVKDESGKVFPAPLILAGEGRSQ